MSGYREDVNEFRKEANWTFWKVFPLFIMVVVVLGSVGFGLKTMGLIGGTIVERKVFENSYQRSEALKSEIAQAQATITVLEQELRGATDEEQIQLLKTKILAANIRLATVKGEQ